MTSFQPARGLLVCSRCTMLVATHAYCMLVHALPCSDVMRCRAAVAEQNTVSVLGAERSRLRREDFTIAVASQRPRRLIPAGRLLGFAAAAAAPHTPQPLQTNIQLPHHRRRRRRRRRLSSHHPSPHPLDTHPSPRGTRTSSAPGSTPQAPTAPLGPTCPALQPLPYRQPPAVGPPSLPLHRPASQPAPKHSAQPHPQ